MVTESICNSVSVGVFAIIPLARVRLYVFYHNENLLFFSSLGNVHQTSSTVGRC